MGDYLILWVIIGVIALAIDIATSAFIFIWFTVGAVAAIIANVLGYQISAQVITFVFVSALFTGVGYPLAKNTIK
ncbi:MAG: NfeD family protein, partial [Bacillota bacterium]|nr:NfeD family protein [Bacillota bacterium]